MSVLLNLRNLVFNIEKTRVSTVVQSRNIIAEIGTKQVGQAVSGERGAVITVCMIISSVGNTEPPVFIFPRTRLHDSLVFGASHRSLRLVIVLKAAGSQDLYS